MQTAKAGTVIEIHQFTGLDGKVIKSGDASVNIDLTSISSAVDVRDVRMRFLLFETYRFPNADIAAKLDMSKFQDLLTTTRITYPLKFTLGLHGVTKDIEAPVTVTHISDKSISVATPKPIVITRRELRASRRHRQALRSGERHADHRRLDLHVRSGVRERRPAAPTGGGARRSRQTKAAGRDKDDLGGRMPDSLQRDLNDRRDLLQDRQRRVGQDERAIAQQRRRHRETVVHR